MSHGRRARAPPFMRCCLAALTTNTARVNMPRLVCRWARPQRHHAPPAGITLPGLRAPCTTAAPEMFGSGLSGSWCKRLGLLSPGGRCTSLPVCSGLLSSRSCVRSVRAKTACANRPALREAAPCAHAKRPYASCQLALWRAIVCIERAPAQLREQKRAPFFQRPSKPGRGAPHPVRPFRCDLGGLVAGVARTAAAP
jgi:hypothetical protein